MNSSILTSTTYVSGSIAGHLLHSTKLGVTPFVALAHTGHRGVDFTRIRSGLKLPLFMGPTGRNSSINIDGMADRRRCTVTISLTFRFSRGIVIRRKVGNHRVRYTILNGSGPRTDAYNRVMLADSFCTCSAGCVSRSNTGIMIPTTVTPRVGSGVQTVTIRTCRALKYTNVTHMSIFLAPRGRIIVGRVGALPNFAGVDVCPGL